MGCYSVYEHAQHESSLLMHQATTTLLTCIGHAVQYIFPNPLYGHTYAMQCLLFLRRVLLIKMHALKQIGARPRYADAFFT